MSEERDTSGRFVAGHTHIPGGAWSPKIPRTPENAARICEMLIGGEMNLDQIAKSMGAAGRSTILMWVAQDQEFQAMYRQAREHQAEAFADELLSIADDSANDMMTVRGAMGKEYEIVNKEVVLRSRLRIDARLRLMASFAPKRYGTKVDHEHSGEVTFKLVRYGDAIAELPAAYIDAKPSNA